MTDATSYRRILKASSITGGGSAIAMLAGIVRIKVIAVLLGPAGVGLIGLYTQTMTTAATLFGLGLGNAGTREIAEAKADEAAIGAARMALTLATALAAATGGLLIWLLREPLSGLILGNQGQAREMGWLALGVALTIVGGSLGALLSGFRRIGDLALSNVVASVGATAIGIALVVAMGREAIVFVVLLAPLLSAITAALLARKLPRHPRATGAAVWPHFRKLVRLGASFLLAGLLAMSGPLVVRVLIARELGPVPLGHYQAAAIISGVYIGFLLQAMITDFYPRLVEANKDPAAGNRLINEQIHIAILLTGPALLGLLALSPWLIRLMYTSQFAEAAVLLRWQIIGDILKVISSPLSFATLAAGESRNYLATEASAFFVLAALSWALLPQFGLVGTAIAYLAMYVVFLGFVYGLAKRRSGFAFTRENLGEGSALLVAAASIGLISIWSEIAAAAVGVALAIGFGLRALATLSRVSALPPIGLAVKRLGERLRGAIGR